MKVWNRFLVLKIYTNTKIRRCPKLNLLWDTVHFQTTTYSTVIQWKILIKQFFRITFFLRHALATVNLSLYLKEIQFLDLWLSHNIPNQILTKTTISFSKISKQFSSLLSPDALEEFLNLKFKSKTKNSKCKKTNSIGFHKSSEFLKRFLFNTYLLPKGFFDNICEFSDLDESSDHAACSMKMDVKRAYRELIGLKIYDDALLIQLLYSFSLNPATLCMLTFENVDKEGILHYKDFSLNSQHKIRLDEKTIEFTLFLINYKGKDHPYFKRTQRKSQNGEIFEGIFMLSVCCSQAYKKFKSQFNGRLKWFNLTPNKIFNLNFEKVHKKKRISQAVALLY